MSDVSSAHEDKMDLGDDSKVTDSLSDLGRVLLSFKSLMTRGEDIAGSSSDDDHDHHGEHGHDGGHGHSHADGHGHAHGHKPPRKPEAPENLTPDGGVVKLRLKKGKGIEMPPKGSEVEVHYTGALLDGTQFDSSLERGEPLKFKLGEGQMIKGFDAAVQTMTKGERCRVALKPDYAYGVAGSQPKIPPNATLVFELELLGWEADKVLAPGLTKRIITAGEGYRSPGYESQVQYQMTLRSPQGAVLFSSHGKEPLKATLGMGHIPRGFERIFESMKKGEHASCNIAATHGFGAQGSTNFNVPANQDLVAEFELVDFLKEKENWELSSFADKAEVGLRRKNEGNDFFKAGNYKLAIKKYKKAADLFSYEGSLSDEEKERARKEVKLPSLLNEAECRLKLEQWKKAVTVASKALEIDSRNVKGLYRRGVAQMSLHEFEKAKKDFDLALEVDPENKAVKASLARLKQLQAAADKKEQARYKKMFEAIGK